MPTYQYACTACGEGLEVVQKFSDDALTECPACSGTLRKVFSAVGIVFKGSGFYRNDSRGSGKSTTPVTTSSTEKKSDSSGSGSDSGSTKSDSSSTSTASSASASSSASTTTAASS
ncbi:FmdB family zinc ribbon protein [Actinocorallia populi]|uniref:FmdB family zinc ribbon protein n=1 Tax=Actinocorallia populi TaxID=2079200 RepID=UPI000D091BA6|nr:FmdB family zinc ribbon protein [Actinocorallia populi]